MRNASNMARRSNAQIEHAKGRVNWDKIRATSDEEIERQRQVDGEDGAADNDGLIIVTAAYVRSIREKLGLTQSQFADQFGLNQRTVQEWEQGRAVPEGPARILLRVIENEPAAVIRALTPESTASR